MSKQLSDYTVYAKYAHYLPDKKRRETWDEMIDRVFGMHRRKFGDILEKSNKFSELFEFAEMMMRKKRVLGSQRVLQFGGRLIEAKNTKLYNCSSTYVDRPRVFQEIMYALLCGAGVGYSVRKHHVKKLPNLVQKARDERKKFVIPDSIEGWADAVGITVCSYFEGENEWNDYFGFDVDFDFSEIRPAGALIAGQFKAPGSDGLRLAIEKIIGVIDKRISSEGFVSDEFAGKLRPIDVHDIILHSADAVISGGIRRAASLSLFDPDDEEMAKCKTGNWFIDNPQRARANNSVALDRETTTKEQFHKLIESTKAFGEPGFLFVSGDEVVNPCCEIGMLPQTSDGRSGLQFCNLSEVNGKYCSDKERFFACCKSAAIIGTLQAAYTDFNYLSKETKEICEREALIGVSITGVMDNADILLDPKILAKGAQIVNETNKEVAKLVGISPAARTTTIKPSGTASVVLQTASGVHPHHSKRYLRRVQANKLEFPARYFKSVNPSAVEHSVWSANDTDWVISFPCEVPRGSILKNQLGAINFLSQIKTIRQNWIEEGTIKDRCTFPYLRHNVSCTVVVRDGEWDSIEEYVFKNREYFGGISFLPFSGDLDYPQAPFATVLSPNEMVDEYGDASVLASGLVVDGLAAFDGDLWAACATATGYGDKLVDFIPEPVFPKRNGMTLREHNKALVEYYQTKDEYDSWFLKKDWIRRLLQFSERYFDGNLVKCTYCLKHVALWHKWLELKRTMKPIDWSTVVEDDREFIAADTLGAQACSGGACDINI